MGKGDHSFAVVDEVKKRRIPAMPKRKLPQKATIPELTSHMLTSVMPTADDVRDCLMGLGVKPTCAAYIVFGMIQKAARGDTAAAKFLNDISQPDAPREDPDTASDLRTLSDAELLRLAGLTAETLSQGEV